MLSCTYGISADTIDFFRSGKTDVVELSKRDFCSHAVRLRPCYDGWWGSSICTTSGDSLTSLGKWDMLLEVLNSFDHFVLILCSIGISILGLSWSGLPWDSICLSSCLSSAKVACILGIVPRNIESIADVFCFLHLNKKIPHFKLSRGDILIGRSYFTVRSTIFRGSFGSKLF